MGVAKEKKSLKIEGYEKYDRIDIFLKQVERTPGETAYRTHTHTYTNTLLLY